MHVVYELLFLNCRDCRAYFHKTCHQFSISCLSKDNVTRY